VEDPVAVTAEVATPTRKELENCRIKMVEKTTAYIACWRLGQVVEDEAGILPAGWRSTNSFNRNSRNLQ
jgi:hypothetical protein